MEAIKKPILRDMIAENKLELAIKRLLNLLKGYAEERTEKEIANYQNVLILFASRLNSIHQQHNLKIISPARFEVMKNELNLSTLEFIDELPNSLFSYDNLKKEQRLERSTPDLVDKQISIEEYDPTETEERKVKEEEFIKEMIKIKAFSEKLEGYWWEKVFPDTDSALSFVRIREEHETKQLKIIGKAYGLDGVIFAKWHSLSCSIDLSQTSLFYVWNGWYYKEPNVLKSGWGKIDFIEQDDSINSGEGLFSDVNPSTKKFESKSLSMKRCGKKEVDIMISDHTSAQKKLILDKLNTFE